MNPEYSDERRTFLKTVVILGGAAVCLPIAKEVAANNRAPLEPSGKKGQGYRETEHIRDYYRVARI